MAVTSYVAPRCAGRSRRRAAWRASPRAAPARASPRIGRGPSGEPRACIAQVKVAAPHARADPQTRPSGELEQRGSSVGAARWPRSRLAGPACCSGPRQARGTCARCARHPVTSAVSWASVSCLQRPTHLALRSEARGPRSAAHSAAQCRTVPRRAGLRDDGSFQGGERVQARRALLRIGYVSGRRLSTSAGRRRP